ncbi:DUF6516 family protein [Pseudomonas sp. R2.Fl]|nr:DUF6516 family protein [Pseudomonas sp. R2.Fl]
MKAERLLISRLYLSETTFVDLKIWRVPKPVRGSDHNYKYSLALVDKDLCVLRYDNEAGKGDHKHIGESEVAYVFVDYEMLQADFWKDVDRWLA